MRRHCHCAGVILADSGKFISLKPGCRARNGSPPDAPWPFCCPLGPHEHESIPAVKFIQKESDFILDNLLSKGHIAREMSGHQECVHGKLCGTQMLPFAERKNADVGIHPRTMHRRIVTCPTFP